MYWILQGNPEVFDIDDYIARYTELIYWRVPKFQKEISIGDSVFLWRAGTDSGIIAFGQVVELPVKASLVNYPQALGDDLWYAERPSLDEPKVGVKLKEIRLNLSEGMIPRSVIKNDQILKNNPIITMPQSTIFRLNSEEANQILNLWGRDGVDEDSEGSSALEGKLQLRSHIRRERSQYLTKKKIEIFRKCHGKLYCEVCGTKEDSIYPATLSASIFEVHHILPLAQSLSPKRTTLEDLAIVCANCHRAIHANEMAEENMKALQKLFN